jgi:glycosyltransferase involved in cell wall biosynthesis
MLSSMPRLLFLKQTSGLRHWFREMCIDLSSFEGEAIVFSDLRAEKTATVTFENGPKYSSKSDSARIWTWLHYFVKALIFTLRVKGNPVLFIVAQPPFLPLIGFLQKKLLKRRYVVWVDDVYPDVLFRYGRLPQSSRIIRLWGAINRRVLGEADHVFTLGPYMMQVLSKYIPTNVPTTVVPTWVDTDFIRPISKANNPFAQVHGQQDKFTVMYSGNLGETHDIAAILTAARELRDRADIHFMIIGSGPQWHSIASSVEGAKDPNISVLPLQPSEILPYSLATADVALVSMGKGVEGISMPSKTYYCMAAGSVILAIAAEQSDLADVIETCHCGTRVSPGDSGSLATTIRYYADHSEITARIKANARAAAETKFSRVVNTRKVHQCLKSSLSYSEDGVPTCASYK